MSSALPLTGVTVVAVEQAVAAPFCTARLADAGATVIKIERPEGDFARGYDDVVHGESSYFVWLNRGKRSMVLDLASPAGRDRLEAQMEEAPSAYRVTKAVNGEVRVAGRNGNQECLLTQRASQKAKQPGRFSAELLRDQPLYWITSPLTLSASS